ncbi:MAG TPA: fatty acid desaturase [Rhizomicrobium sp.]|nr:fatty acid desaturase [Rhizomicrobium sp.]
MRKTIADIGLLAVAGAIAVLQFGAFPLLFSPGGAGAVVLIAVAALSAPLHYGLMHETMHGNLFRSEGWNRAVGRVLGVTLGLPWETMRFGHLAHHAFNRHKFDRPEYLSPEDSYAGAAPVYFAKLVLGNAVIYALAPYLALPPISTTGRVVALMGTGEDNSPFRQAALRTFSNPARRARIRFDLMAFVLLAVMAVIAWRAQWWVFALCILARWSVLSLLDNAPHYGMALDSRQEARNTTFPRRLSFLVLNQNFHGTHHHTPDMHWTDLPEAFRASSLGNDGSWIGAVLRQFRGPVRLR